MVNHIGDVRSIVLCLTACSRQMDIVIVLDMSGSYTEIFDTIFVFTRQLILGLPVGPSATRIAVVRYSSFANVTFHLNEYSNTQQVTTATIVDPYSVFRT